MKIIKYCTTLAGMRTLPVFSVLLALFKLFMCTENTYHHQWWCMPWEIILLPFALYAMYFISCLIFAIRIANKLKRVAEHIEIEVG